MPAGVSAITALANITLANSTTTTVTFSSISGSYRDLLIVWSGTTQSTFGNRFYMNNDQTFGNTHYVAGWASGSSVFASQATNQGFIISINVNSTTTQNQSVIHVMDYAQTDKHKTILSRADVPNLGVVMQASRWTSTAAVTSVVVNNAGVWNSGTTISLYGVSS
jgi:hypothetical protein